MTGLWQDAISILETASAARESGPSEIAILIDDRNGMRIVDAAGWQLDALKREYSAKTAYTVKRRNGSVLVEASSGGDQFTLKKNLAKNPLAAMISTIPHHLVAPQQALLS
ncbi:MAG TPA: hypothetical protein VH351_12265 [Bryobacteraceae bacterium]|nr:hypothetical protein [Bryobacteraceae bacterium]